MLDAKCVQSSLSKADSIHIVDYPKASGCRECFEGAWEKESDKNFLKSAIALPFQVKKKVEKKTFLKDLGAHVVKLDLVPNKVSNCADGKDSDRDFGDDDEWQL